MADAVRAAAAPQSGASAVAGASSLQNLAQAETVPAQEDSERLRIVENRSYFLRDGVWIDSAFANEETIKVALFSNAYFELVDLVPWIGPHLAIGDHVILAVGDVFLEIAEDGAEAITPTLTEVLTP